MEESKGKIGLKEIVRKPWVWVLFGLLLLILAGGVVFGIFGNGIVQRMKTKTVWGAGLAPFEQTVETFVNPLSEEIHIAKRSVESADEGEYIFSEEEVIVPEEFLEELKKAFADAECYLLPTHEIEFLERTNKEYFIFTFDTGEELTVFFGEYTVQMNEKYYRLKGSVLSEFYNLLAMEDYTYQEYILPQTGSLPAEVHPERAGEETQPIPYYGTECDDGFLVTHMVYSELMPGEEAGEMVPALSKYGKNGELMWRREYHGAKMPYRNFRLLVYPLENGEIFYQIQYSDENDTGDQKVVKCDWLQLSHDGTPKFLKREEEKEKNVDYAYVVSTKSGYLAFEARSGFGRVGENDITAISVFSKGGVRKKYQTTEKLGISVYSFAYDPDIGLALLGSNELAERVLYLYDKDLKFQWKRELSMVQLTDCEMKFTKDRIVVSSAWSEGKVYWFDFSGEEKGVFALADTQREGMQMLSDGRLLYYTYESQPIAGYGEEYTDVTITMQVRDENSAVLWEQPVKMKAASGSYYSIYFFPSTSGGFVFAQPLYGEPVTGDGDTGSNYYGISYIHYAWDGVVIYRKNVLTESWPHPVVCKDGTFTYLL